ncbi:MAG: hypothetical protein LLG42_15120 [Chloroflexi bacterium]|nr:hypothetical protein [Chloroflexota bacterium]
MGFYGGGGWRGYLQSDDEKPRVTRRSKLRVFKYSKPYRRQLIGMLAAILVTTAPGLLVP